jgi:hypothetical protein
MNRLTFAVLCLAAALTATSRSAADDAAVNTPEVLSRLQGGWVQEDGSDRTDSADRAIEGGEAFRQRLNFAGGQCGQWHQSRPSLPVSITYYVEGGELLIQNYHEPARPFDYRMQQRRFRYELDGDTLTLTGEGNEGTRWRRTDSATAEPDAVRPEPTSFEYEGFSLRETILSPERSRFEVEIRKSDAQLGIVFATLIAKVAHERGFPYFTRAADDGEGGFEVRFLKRRPAEGAEEAGGAVRAGNEYVFETATLLALLPEEEASR